MDFFKFLISKTLLKNLIAAFILLIILIFGLKLYLANYTRHNEYHLVPDLTNKTFEEASRIAQDRQMNIVILDTVDYNPKYKKYAIVEQNPHKSSRVKVGRKIYVEINNNTYEKVSFPDVIGKSKRQAISVLKSSGLQIGKITTKPYFAEIVLAATHKKDSLKTGFKIFKNSVINLVVGDGKHAAVENEDENKNDTDTENNTQNTDVSIQKTLNDVLGN